MSKRSQNHKKPDISIDEMRQKLIKAMLGHVIFTGWSEVSFKAACKEAKIEEDIAWGIFPAGAVDMLKALHRDGDDAMIAHFLAREDLERMKVREKIIEIIMIRFRLMQDYRDAVRMSLSFFALAPHHPDGLALMWQSADKVWEAVGDTSDDFNFYSKRVLFSMVYSSSLLYWLDDDSPDFAATYGFVQRRVENVMQIEKCKSSLRRVSLFRNCEDALNRVGRRMRTKAKARYQGVPASLGRQ